MIRNKDTGLIEGKTYERKEDQTIDWRKMVPDEFLYLNPAQKPQLEKKYGKRYEDIKVSDAEDKELVLLLQGVRFLLNLRGFVSVETTLTSASPEYAAANCRIKFIPNTENPTEQVYSDSACASHENTRGFGQKYLVEMCSNRAMARCVRAYLNIGIVTREELVEGVEEVTSGNNKLKDLMERKGLTFALLKSKAAQNPKKYENAESWTSLNDIPTKYYPYLIEALNKVNDKD